MPLWIAFSLLLQVCYIFLMRAYRLGWNEIPEWQIPTDWQAQTAVTVLIPARNEAQHITPCIESILAGSYAGPLLEIIVLDDFSDDATVAVVHQIAARLPVSGVVLRTLQLADVLPADAVNQANKKTAIELGIAHASGKIIVTTDADCNTGKDWLPLLISRLECSDTSAMHPLLVTGPVQFQGEQNILEYFQSLDMLGLMGITGAGIQRGFQRMGNGANLAYYRSTFLEAGGYEGNRTTASGDDMFLIQKVAALHPGRIAFVKNAGASVFTKAKPDWRSFVQQRLRWGTKNAGLPEWPVRLVLLAVFLFCWSIWINLLAVFCFWGNASIAALLLIQIATKVYCDWLLLRRMCVYFHRIDLLRWFPPSFVLHTLYIPLVGTASLFYKKYVWKGREVGA